MNREPSPSSLVDDHGEPEPAVVCDRLVAMADLEPGPPGRTGPDARFDVAVAGRTLSDYLDLATDQILLYGHTDPEVTAALSRLALTVEQAAPSKPDRRHARNLADRITRRASDARVAAPPTAPVPFGNVPNLASRRRRASRSVLLTRPLGAHVQGRLLHG